MSEGLGEPQAPVSCMSGLDVPTLDSKDFLSFGEMLEKIMCDEVALPVWIQFGRARHQITPENKRGVCRGMLMALEWRQQNGHI